MDLIKAKENQRKANKELSMFYKKYKLYLINYVDKQIEDDSSEGLSETSIGFDELFFVLNKTLYPSVVTDFHNFNVLTKLINMNLSKHYRKLGFSVAPMKNSDGILISWEGEES